MINSISSSPYSVQVLPSVETMSQDQQNRQALHPTTQALQPTTAAQLNQQAGQDQQVKNDLQNAHLPHATVNTSGQTMGSLINIVA